MKKVNLNWIKGKIVERYSGTQDDNMERKLLISKSMSAYERLGYYFFALNGSPPKGCAIYQPDHSFLIIVDAWGKTRKFCDICVEGLNG